MAIHKYTPGLRDAVTYAINDTNDSLEGVTKVSSISEIGSTAGINRLDSSLFVVGDDGLLSEQAKRTSGNKIALLGNSITYQNGIRNAGGYTPWDSSTAKTVSNQIIPRHIDLSGGFWPHLYYTCVTAGTTGTVEPDWPTTIGQQVTDGTVVWEATALRSDVVAWDMGAFVIAQQLSGQRLQEVYISGRSGKLSSEILLYVDKAIASGADIIFVQHLFENDTTAALTLAQIQANWEAAAAKFDHIRSIGKKLMLGTVLPNGNIDATSTFTGYSKANGTKIWHWLNAKIREYCAINTDVIIWDCANLYVDTDPANPVWPENTVTYPTGNGSTGKKTDGVHPANAAKYLLAKSLATVISANFPTRNNFSEPLSDFSWSTNPGHYGTGGAKGASTYTPTGSVADGYTAYAYGTNVTASVCSKVARTDIAGEFTQQTYVVTGTVSSVNDNAALQTAQVAIASTPFSIGDSVQGFAEIKVLANPTALFNVVLQNRFWNGTPGYHYSTNQASSEQLIGGMITEDTLFTLKSVPFKIPTGTTAFTEYLKALAGGSNASFTVQYGRISRRKVDLANIA